MDAENEDSGTHPWYAALLVGLTLPCWPRAWSWPRATLTPPTMGLEHQRRLDQLRANDNGGVTVYSDHLEGDAWGENIGWIRLGTHTGGGSHTYANDAASTYGVNNDGAGNLSGYAWGANVGWINFDPDGAERRNDRPGHRRLRRLRLGREHGLDPLPERQPGVQSQHGLATHQRSWRQH